ncbi:FecR domain-containing protein [Candidatus Woesearchaeota archaeon]|nr:FecR domain-containing protein [Candidatus Woesearchaeota archaeon]
MVKKIKEEKPRKRKFWKIFFALIVLIIVVILGTGLYFYWPYLQFESSAVLNIEKGKTEVDSGKGFVEAKNGMQLKENWIVRTNEESEAEIIFLGSTSVKLDELSSLIIKKIDKENRVVSIEQAEGNIWYDLLEGSGIKIEIETPDGNFTNEGTSFGCSVSIAQPRFVVSAPKITKPIGTVIPVIRGSVVQKTTENHINKITAGTQSTIIKTNPIKNEQIIRNKFIEKNEDKYNKFVEKRRNELKKKYRRNIALAKRMFPQITDEILNSYIDKVLKGEININDKIKEGTIPISAIKFIPSEIISNTITIDTPVIKTYEPIKIDPPIIKTTCPQRYRIKCEAKMTCNLNYYIQPQDKANQELFGAFKEWVDSFQKEDKQHVDNGKWIDDTTYVYNFQTDRGGWGVGCSCYEAMNECQKNVEKANEIAQNPVGLSYPSAYIYASRMCSTNSIKEVLCEKIE